MAVAAKGGRSIATSSGGNELTGGGRQRPPPFVICSCRTEAPNTKPGINRLEATWCLRPEELKLPTYLSQEDFFHRYYEPFEDGIEPSDENLALIRSFLLDKWRERASELGLPEPSDLSDSCKFSALFGSVVFGADIGGNYRHVYNLVGGKIVDINSDARDVKGRSRIYEQDSDFISSYDFRESMKTCRERVSKWLAEFGKVYEEQMERSVTISP